MLSGLLLAAGDSGGIESEIITRAGGAAAAVALIGIALVLPLYLTQRREVRRLERWRELEPERGDESVPGHPRHDAYLAASAAAAAQPRAAAPTTSTRLSPAERVTADRPALSRITAERAALQSPSFWRRFLARGPRHPIALALIGILVAAAVVVGVGFVTGTIGDSKDGTGGGAAAFDRSAVSVTVLNATDDDGVADDVARTLEREGFEGVRTGLTDSSGQTVVQFTDGNKRAANAIAGELDVSVLQPMDRDVQADADGAQVVVVAGEDRAGD